MKVLKKDATCPECESNDLKQENFRGSKTGKIYTEITCLNCNRLVYSDRVTAILPDIKF